MTEKKKSWVSDVAGRRVKFWWAFAPDLTLCACEEITDRENRAHWGTVHKINMPQQLGTALLDIMDKTE